MSQNDREIYDKNPTDEGKAGIDRASASLGRWGRPTVMDRKGDPNLASKASEMRSKGLSWSQIASGLGVSRSSAKRLARVYQKDANRPKEYRFEESRLGNSVSDMLHETKEEIAREK